MQVSTTEAHAKARCPRYLSQRLLAKGINFEKKGMRNGGIEGREERLTGVSF